MVWLKQRKAQWSSLRAAFRREFLRDPDVILFSRGGDAPSHPREDRAGAR